MSKLSKFEGKMVRLITNDGHQYEGFVGDYIYPEDNEPEGVEAVILDPPLLEGNHKTTGLMEFVADEIKEIETI